MSAVSILSKAISGKRGRAQKVVLFGPEGIGKSSMAALFPNPLFGDIEGGTSQLDVWRLDREALPDLPSFESALDEVAKTKPCSTFVVDTVDWLEPMAEKELFGDKGIESPGYGKGYTILKERFTLLLAKFDAVIASGVNVVLLAHSKVNKFEPPDGAGPYDRYELKLSKYVAPLVKEWADMLLFCNWRVQVREKDKNEAGAKFKGVGGKERQIHCVRTSAWDAKNRHGMADTEKWDIAVIQKAFAAVGAPWNAKPISQQPQTPVDRGTSAAEPQKPQPEPPRDTAPAAPAAAQDPEGIPGVENPVDAELARICEPHADAVTNFLRERNQIKADQDWRSTPPDYAARIKKNPANFLKMALNGKVVAA